MTSEQLQSIKLRCAYWTFIKPAGPYTAIDCLMRWKEKG